MAAKHVGNGVTTETETVLHPMSILKDAIWIIKNILGEK